MGRVVIAVCLALALWVAPASAERRIALVIGNSNYAQGRLPDAANDAKLVAQTLSDLGFEVLEPVIDADKRAMERGVRDLVDALQAANDAARAEAETQGALATFKPDTVGFLYYAGHGVQAEGANYLIPLGADIRRQTDLEFEAVDAKWVLDRLDDSDARLRFVLLDACRNNPIPESIFRSSGTGLAEMTAALGTFIGYATSPGKVAFDGRGEHGPYAEAFAAVAQRPGLTAESMFRALRNQVVETTDGYQVPWDASNLIGQDFCFSGPCGDGGAAAAEARAALEAAEAERRDLAIERIADGLDVLGYGAPAAASDPLMLHAGVYALSLTGADAFGGDAAARERVETAVEAESVYRDLLLFPYLPEDGLDPSVPLEPAAPPASTFDWGSAAYERAAAAFDDEVRRLARLNLTLTNACEPIEFSLYFEWDRAVLTPAAAATVEAAMARARACPSPPGLVLVEGHEDTSLGPVVALVNSARRGRAAADALIASGLLGDVALRVVPKGSTDLAAPTAEGVREPLNRRVLVSIRF